MILKYGFSHHCITFFVSKMMFRVLLSYTLALCIFYLVAGEEEPYYKNVTVCEKCVTPDFTTCAAYAGPSMVTIDSLCYQGDANDTNYEFNFDPLIPDSYNTSCSTCVTNSYTFFVR